MDRNATNRTVTAGLWVGLGMLVALFYATPAQAQLKGESLLGDMGVKSATQAEPGLYVSSIYYRYCTDTIEDPNGKSLSFDPTGEAKQAIHAAIHEATKTKLPWVVKVRHWWDEGGRVKTPGQTFTITRTIPLGTIRIPARN